MLILMKVMVMTLMMMLVTMMIIHLESRVVWRHMIAFNVLQYCLCTDGWLLSKVVAFLIFSIFLFLFFCGFVVLFRIGCFSCILPVYLGYNPMQFLIKLNYL